MKSDTQQLILEAGKHEFLTKGFQEASLRCIAQEAGVTTGAIYGYYADKAALFQALVEPAASTFKERFLLAQTSFTRLPVQEQIDAMHSYSMDALQALLDYVYEHLDAFRLIVSSSAGTAYADYVESMVEIEAESSKAYMQVVRGAGFPVPALSDNLIHILSKAYFTAVFETVAHDMHKDEADAYVSQISIFFHAGWKTLFALP